MNIQDPFLEEAVSTASPDQGYQSMEEDRHDVFPVPNAYEDPDINSLISVYLDSPEDYIKDDFTEMILDKDDDSLENIKIEGKFCNMQRKWILEL